MNAIDLFAGAGGFTTGAEAAGARVVWAANHWRLAVDTHEANHPHAHHECQDLHQADWRDVPAHDLLLASPACTGHTPARGKERPHHDAARSTAWAVVSCLEYHRTAFALVENVPAFRAWALYPAWRMAVGALGYSVSELVVDAADLGVPQNRERLFLVLARSLAPLRLELERRPHAPIGPVIRWDAYRWSPVEKRGRAASTLARVERGRQEIGPRFVAPYYGSGSGETGRSVDRPLGTVTTIDRWSVVDGDRMRMLQVDEYVAAMGFPADYRLPKRRDRAIKLLGNAVCPPVARELVLALRRAA